ncbi:MAG: PrsW family intramembrane metalloprotease [Bacteroidales bacterium]|nr:PrsW family intramembrane metalloprotease [Bacteroidales bacterium]
MKIVFSLAPVLLFLVSLYLLDSFKLVSRNILIICLLWGIIAALISYFLNTWLVRHFSLNFNLFSRYLAPITEEITKAMVVLYLISRQKIGFAIDAAIYGFAAGAGFALAENVVYLVLLKNDPTLIIWILRGFGTALMHGGCTALVAMLVIGGIQREKPMILAISSGLLAAFLLHSIFNHFFVSPYLQTALIFIVLPIVFAIVFKQSTTVLQNWLEIEFSTEIELLRMIKQGKLRGTKAGEYLVKMKQHFAPETILDLYCYLSLYLELSIKAKRNLMLKENGFPVVVEPEIIDKLNELKQLRRQIGKMGELAIQPLVRMKHRDLWELNLLRNI